MNSRILELSFHSDLYICMMVKWPWPEKGKLLHSSHYFKSWLRSFEKTGKKNPWHIKSKCYFLLIILINTHISILKIQIMATFQLKCKISTGQNSNKESLLFVKWSSQICPILGMFIYMFYLSPTFAPTGDNVQVWGVCSWSGSEPLHGWWLVCNGVCKFMGWYCQGLACP